MNKPHVHVTAGLIWKDERVLISKRQDGTHLGGMWEFPGGKQEPGESLKYCLAREIEEELGVKVRVDEPFLTVPHEYQTKYIFLHVYNCTLMSGEPRALECQEIRWIHPAELQQYRFPPPDSKVIELLQTDRMNSQIVDS